MQNIGRSLDSYGRTTASDAAASTASIIFSEVSSLSRLPVLHTQCPVTGLQSGDDYDSRSRSRHNSFSGSYDNAYVYDDPLMFDRPHSRHRSHSRRRSHSHSQQMLLPGGQYGSSAIPIPGTSVMVPTHYGGGSYGGGGYMPASYPMPGYGHASYGNPSMLAVPSTSYSRHRASSVSMPMPMPYSASAGVPVVISTSGRKHKHRRSHSSSKRSRSSDPTLRIEYPGYSRSGY